MFNRSADQGYGVYLENTNKVRLVRNDVRGIGGKLLSHQYCTDKALYLCNIGGIITCHQFRAHRFLRDVPCLYSPNKHHILGLLND